MSEQVTFTSPPTGSQPPVDGGTKPPAPNDAPKGDRPAWLPEQFKTAEDFAKSWTDQRAEITRVQQELAALKKPADTKTDDKPADKPADLKVPEGDDKAAADAVKAAGFDISPFQKEFDETGAVSPENLKKIADGMKGVLGEHAETLVTQWYEGRVAAATNFTNSVIEAAGGTEAYAEMVRWAKGNMSKAEIDTYNKAVNSGDINAARMAVDGLKSRASSAGGLPPDLLGGGSDTAVDGFANSFEMTSAMSDPLYGKDPAYTKSVEQKVYRSKF